MIMGLINRRNVSITFLFSLFSFLFAPALSAQTGTIASELQRLDALIKDTAAEVGVKKEALNTKARLLELTGNIEDAASVWNEAAFAEAAKRDDKALVKSAACFAAMGEYAQADTALKTILLTSNDAQSVKEARFLSAQIEVLRNGEKGLPVLLAFLENPDYASSQPQIYYLLWKISGSESHKAKLIADFPQSPEALLARDENASIVPLLTPMWVLFPGREQLAFSAPSAEASTENTVSAHVGIENEEKNTPPILIQVGLYSKEENAVAMLGRLKSKGFTASISSKTVSGTTYWQVTIPPGTDANRTIMILKDAGFESFPVF